LFYGRDTQFLTLREENRLRVFENWVLRRIFGPKRDEVTGEWRKLHHGELHNLSSSPDIVRQVKSRRMWWVGHGRGEKSVQGFGGKARRKRPLGRPMRKWEDGIKMDLREIGLGGGCGVDSRGSG
jgi:hypothetical protein